MDFEVLECYQIIVRFFKTVFLRAFGSGLRCLAITLAALNMSYANELLVSVIENKEGEKIDVVLHSLKGENVSFLRVYDGRDFVVPISSLSSKSIARIEAWNANSPSRSLERLRLDIVNAYYQGLILEQNKELAFEICKISASNGHAGAQCVLGMWYLDGTGNKGNKVEGIKWLKASAEQGEHRAQERLGHVYIEGLGVGVDYKKAAYYLKPSAEAGNSLARAKLGYLYSYGLGVRKDLNKGVFLLRLAAKDGSESAQALLKVVNAQLSQASHSGDEGYTSTANDHASTANDHASTANDLFPVWKDPLHKDDPLAPHNDPLRAGDPLEPWNDPLGDNSDLSNRDRKKYGLPN